MHGTFTTESPALARAQRSTRYTLARQLGGPGHTYDVLDAVTAACDEPQGLTFSNALR
jgi:hypothetical protein